MSPERWERLDRVFANAVGLPPGERPAYVRAACDDDVDLCSEVMALLASDGDAGTSLRRVVGLDRSRRPR